MCEWMGAFVFPHEKVHGCTLESGVLILSESISMKSTWSTSMIPSWEVNGSGTKCSGWRLFVRQTEELAQNGVWPRRPVAQVKTSPLSQKCQRRWQSYSDLYCTSSASWNSLKRSKHGLLNRLAINIWTLNYTSILPLMFSRCGYSDILHWNKSITSESVSEFFMQQSICVTLLTSSHYSM